MHSRCSRLALFVLFLWKSPTDAKPRTRIALRALPPGGVRRATRCEVPQLPSHPRVGLACLAKMSSSRLSSPFSLCTVSLASSKSSSRSMVTACALEFVPLLLLVRHRRLDKASLGSSITMCHFTSNTSPSVNIAVFSGNTCTPN